MTTPLLAPVHLESEPSSTFRRQLADLRRLTEGLAEWAPPAHIDDPVAEDVQAVVVPDLSGRAYGMVSSFRRIDVPILAITSEFGTVSMWDWEIRDHLRRRGVATVAPTSLEETHDVLRALATRAALARSTMLAYQDDLGAGMQPDIFKRFYWWEQECVTDMQDRFGVTIEQRSYRDLVARATALDDDRVRAAVEGVESDIDLGDLAPCAREDAVRLYLALDDDIDETGDVIAVGVNCLNESATATTTPCLAFDLLFEDRGILWGCEADLMSMLTEVLVHRTLQVPVMMTNLYPFLMGQAALAHEGIPHFPEVDDPVNHVLVAHCGYFGEIPRTCALEWACRPPVLGIVDDNAHAIDARYPEGPTTMVKIASDMETLTVTPAELTGYVQYEDSDCLNGGVLRIADGHRFVESLPSHHTVLATGNLVRRIELMADVMGLRVEHI